MIRLLIFCKAPIPGTVKTRLISYLGEAGATSLHWELSDRLIRECLESRISGQFDVELWCYPTTSDDFFNQFNVTLHLQQGGNLGERMDNAFRRTGSPAILIGTDCPNLDAGYLQRATTLLASHDAVLGPAEDGGYGLIGLQQPNSALFNDMNWGTDQVASDTSAELNRQQLHWSLLPLLWDVDRPEDVRRYRALHQS